MIATINGIAVMGTPQEIKEFQEITTKAQKIEGYRSMTPSNYTVLRTDEDFSALNVADKTHETM